jgi:hypothetical protein
MEKSKGRIHVFDMLKANLVKELGKKEGTRAFDAFLNRHNVKEYDNLKNSLNDEREEAREPFSVTQPLLTKAVA